MTKQWTKREEGGRSGMERGLATKGRVTWEGEEKHKYGKSDFIALLIGLILFSFYLILYPHQNHRHGIHSFIHSKLCKGGSVPGTDEREI